MGAWHGPQRKGAARDRRTVKRTEAEARNARTKRSRRRQARLKGEVIAIELTVELAAGFGERAQARLEEHHER